MELQLPAVLTRSAYRAQQASIRYSLLAAHLAVRAVTRRDIEPSEGALEALRREYESLLERDLENVEAGLYPASLLFQAPIGRYLWKVPSLLEDIPRTLLRARRGDYQDLPEDVDVSRYPAYFRRTFHWQTDGYLSRRSAELYDVGVEFLFMGCADVMRRQVIPPMAELAAEIEGDAKGEGERLRILDVACGTGRTLSQIAEALPGNQYVGVDLSPFYLEKAREDLREVPELTLLAENAEKLPFRDDHFDIVTSVYLFHELPRPTRRKVMAELVRVLRPGGLLVIEDSAQLREAADLEIFLDGFQSDMHEPFYADYVRDPLEGLFEEAGLAPEPTRRAWLSKVVSARKQVEPA